MAKTDPLAAGKVLAMLEVPVNNQHLFISVDENGVWTLKTRDMVTAFKLAEFKKVIEQKQPYCCPSLTVYSDGWCILTVMPPTMVPTKGKAHG